MDFMEAAQVDLLFLSYFFAYAFIFFLLVFITYHLSYGIAKEYKKFKNYKIITEQKIEKKLRKEYNEKYNKTINEEIDNIKKFYNILKITEDYKNTKKLAKKRG